MRRIRRGTAGGLRDREGAEAGADGLLLQLAGGGAGQGGCERDPHGALEVRQAVRERDRVDARVQFVQGAAQVAPGQLNALRVPVVPEV